MASAPRPPPSGVEHHRGDERATARHRRTEEGDDNGPAQRSADAADPFAHCASLAERFAAARLAQRHRVRTEAFVRESARLLDPVAVVPERVIDP